jgi:hypothetical protein
MTAQKRAPQQPFFKLLKQRFITFSKNDSIESIIIHAYPVWGGPEAFHSTANVLEAEKIGSRGKCGNGMANCGVFYLPHEPGNMTTYSMSDVDISMEHLCPAPRFSVSEWLKYNYLFFSFSNLSTCVVGNQSLPHKYPR